MGKWLWVIALLVLGFGANYRALEIGYLSDDWAILSYVHRHGNGPHWTGPWLGLEEAFLIHRPVATGLYSIELYAFGADPLPAHVHHLLWHLATVLLIYVAILQLGGRRSGAFLGALLFAFHPYLPATTGWLAGRASVASGTLTLLTLVAFLRFHRRGDRVAYAVAVIAAAGAALSRETGYLALILPLTYDLLCGRPRPLLPALLRRHLAFAVVGAALLVLRYRALGTLGGGYAAAGGLTGDAPSSAVLATFGEALLRVLGGVPPEFVGNVMLLPIAVGVLTVVLLAWGWTRRPQTARGAGLFLIAAFFTNAGVLLLSGPTLAASTGQRWYVGFAFVAMLLGLAIGFLPRRARWIAVILVPLYLMGHWRVQDVLLDSDRLAKRLVAAVDESLAAIPGDSSAIFVSGFPQTQLGLPFVQWGFSDAFRPPFRAAPPKVPIYPVKQFMELGLQAAPTWPLHPPVEMLLYARGERPVALRFEQRPDGLGLARTDLGTLDRATAEALARRAFHPEALVGPEPRRTHHDPPHASPRPHDHPRRRRPRPPGALLLPPRGGHALPGHGPPGHDGNDRRSGGPPRRLPALRPAPHHPPRDPRRVRRHRPSPPRAPPELPDHALNRGNRACRGLREFGICGPAQESCNAGPDAPTDSMYRSTSGPPCHRPGLPIQ